MKGGLVARWAPVLASGGIAASFVFRLSTVTVAGRQVTLFDDAMISMRYARNLADGHGLVFNPGSHPVQGYTSLIWTLWMSASRVVPDAERWSPLAVALSAVAAAMLTVEVAGRIAELASPATAAACIARWGTALLFPLIGWSVVGMEVAPLALLLSLAVLFVLRSEGDGGTRFVVGAGAAIALAILVRTDAAVPGVAIVLWCLWPRGRRSGLKTGAAIGASVLCALATTILFSLLYYGHPWPNTYYLKLLHIPLSTRIHRGTADLMWSGLTLLAAPILLGFAAFTVREHRRTLSLLLGVAAAQMAYAVYVGGDSYDGSDMGSRFVAVIVPLLVVAAAVGVVSIARGMVTRRSIVVAGAAAAAWLIAQAFNERPGQSFQLGPYQSHSVLYRVAPAVLLLVALVAAVAVGRIPLASWGLGASTAALSVSLLAGAGGLQTLAELHTPNMAGDFDSTMVHVALDLRRATDPSAVIGTGAIGQIGYFSHRRIVDLLGYTDSHIATRPPSGTFIPGHDKSDLAYSIGLLRPDILVAVLASGAESDAVRKYGYELLAPGLWVRTGSPHVNLAKMGPLVAIFTPK